MVDKKATKGTEEKKAPEWYKPIKNCHVAIVGFAPSSMGLAPFDNQSIEIWGINELYIVSEVTRIDRLFELHSYERFTQKDRNPNHLKWLQENKDVLIYTQRKYKDIPRSIAFPFDVIVEKTQTNYFTNSISWLIAFAVISGAKKIELWGIDMARAEEYESQRPSVEYFVGWARGLGVEVLIPDQSDILLTTHLYGLEEEKQTRIQEKLKARKGELGLIIRNLRRDLKLKQSELDQYVGAHLELRQQEKAYSPMSDAKWSAGGGK